MSVSVPAPSVFAQVSARVVSAGSESQSSPTDGSTQRVLRIGDKHAVDVQLPTMEERRARLWLGPWKISQAEGATVVMPWPQPPFEGPIGAPKVNGASQAGTSLVIDGLTPGLFIGADRFFSFVANGRHYIHSVTRDVVANASGQATITVSPMLRRSPADNADLDFVTPHIEGFMSAPPAWTLGRRRFFGGVSFTITENA